MTNPRVICLGEILFDYLSKESGKSLPEVTQWIAHPGGAPANVATALVKLGTSAAFIGCVGNDAEGQNLVKFLDSLGVNTSSIVHHPSALTRKVYVLRSENGERIFAGFGEYPADAFADAYLSARDLSIDLFETADYLVFGTLELAYPQTREAIFHALELADKYYLKIVLDVNRRSVFWQNEAQAKPLIDKLWKYIDFVKFSQEEALWLFDTTDAAKISHQLNSVEGVIITGGGEVDINYCINDYVGSISPYQVEVIDTTGAGDAFVAGLVHQLLEKGISKLNNPDIVHQIVSYASAVGALTTTKMGAMAAQPTALEVEKFYRY